MKGRKMKAKLVLVIAIIISAINISYGSLDEPKTREEFEQKVEQQRAEIKKLKTKISEQEKEILELKWEIYRLKHKPEPNSIAESETKDTNTNKLQTGIDPNSEPNDISKLMTEEEQEAEERWAEYKTYLEKASQQKYKPPKPTEARRPENRAIGISYHQVMEYLSDFFSMEKSPLVDGRDRYIAQSANNMAILEIIGNKNNISSTTLSVFFPNDAPEILIENTAMLLRFLKNTVPGWPNSSDWVTAALNEFVNSPNSSKSIVKGNKLITIQIIKPLGMITLTVKHKSAKY